MFLFLFQIRNKNIPWQREADKHIRTACNKYSLFMPQKNPTTFFLWVFLFGSSQEAFVPAVQSLLPQVTPRIFIFYQLVAYLA